MHRLLGPDHLRELARRFQRMLVALTIGFVVIFSVLGVAILATPAGNEAVSAARVVAVLGYLIVAGLVITVLVRVASYRTLLRAAAEYSGPSSQWSGLITSGRRTYVPGRYLWTRYRIAVSSPQPMEMLVSTVGPTGRVAPAGEPVTLQAYGLNRPSVGALHLHPNGPTIPVVITDESRRAG